MTTDQPTSPGNPAGASNRRESGKSMALDLDRTQDTPAGDLQADDAGTPASGERPGGATVRSAMKQTSKTPAERGSGQEASGSGQASAGGRAPGSGQSS